MKNSDFVHIARLLNRKNEELAQSIYNFEKHFNTFKKFDELDAVELHRLLITKQVLEEIEVDILKLCDFLIKYNDD